VTALRIFRPPALATVTLRDGKPAHVACSRRKEISGEVSWTAGPWRSSGDWWEQEGWARDEWDIALQNENGIALYRLVRDLLDGRWLVEGTYD
jgi:protein ImuB